MPIDYDVKVPGTIFAVPLADDGAAETFPTLEQARQWLLARHAGQKCEWTYFLPPENQCVADLSVDDGSYYQVLAVSDDAEPG